MVGLSWLVVASSAVLVSSPVEALGRGEFEGERRRDLSALMGSRTVDRVGAVSSGLVLSFDTAVLSAPLVAGQLMDPADHPICEADPTLQACGATSGLSAPVPTATATPVPTPTPDPRVLFEAAHGEALAGLRDQLRPPAWRIWPPPEAQVVNLDSFLHIAGPVEPVTSRGAEGSIWVEFVAVPIESVWRFDERHDVSEFWLGEVRCAAGMTEPWTEGDTEPACAKHWDHSSAVTGPVEMTVGFVYDISYTTNYANPALPQPGRQAISDPRPTALTVNEIQAIGHSPVDPVVEYGGFCDRSWGAGAMCWVGDKAKDAGVAALRAAADGLVVEVLDFLEGCGDAALEALGGIADTVAMLWDFVNNPGEFLDEQWDSIQAAIAAAKDDPAGFATELLGEAVSWEEFNTDKTAWAGKVGCQLAISFFTGAAADKLALLNKIDRFAGRNNRNSGESPDAGRNDRDRNDDPDRTEDRDDNRICDGTNPGIGCRCDNSFPTGTRVLMDTGRLTPIEKIRPGDQVISYNLDTRRWEPKTVLDQWSHPHRGPPATATLGDGSTITATADHLFYDPAIGEWTELQHLRAGGQLHTPNGPTQIANLTIGPPGHPWTVHELTIADNHNYTVHTGTQHLLAHNTCWRLSPPAPDTASKGVHFTIDGVELAARPGTDGSVLFRAVFSSTSDSAASAAIRRAHRALTTDAHFRARLLSNAERSLEYLHGNSDLPGATGRQAEIRFLIKALGG